MTANVHDVASYWNRRPCNIRHSPEQPGTLAFYQQAHERKMRVEPHIEAFAAFPVYHGKRVLEIGCGLGFASIDYALNGATVTAVDLSANSLNLAKAHAQAMSVDKRITFVQANVERLHQMMRVEPFDLIYSFGVLHHTPNPAKAMTELRHYARPGTRLKLMLYHKHSTKWLRLLVTHGRNAHQHSEAAQGCPVTYTYSRREARTLVEQAGFAVEQIRVEHIFPYQVEAYKQYEYRRAFPWAIVPDPAFRALERSMGWHLLIDARAK
jgi:2-polyprenyl-3-methyl-5-hydroxy-6-metoxy-1,4-benzoquinol methylase